MNPTTLIIGATGKTGRHVVQQLTTRSIGVRAGSRNPGPTTSGVETVTFDWDDSTTWAPALDGVDRAYLVPPAFSADPATPVASFLRGAPHLQRVVVLSVKGVDQAPGGPMVDLESAVREWAREWTILRPNWFMQNFSEGVFASAVQAGVLAFPTGDGRTSFVHTRDIAAVAVEALLGTGHAGQGYTITGPEALSYADVADLLSRALGRDVRFENVTPDHARAGLVDAGLPGFYADVLITLLAGVKEGREADVSDVVPRLTGRAAARFEEFAAEVAPMAAEPVSP